MALRSAFLRVHLVATTATDLVCIACGGFRTEWAITVAGAFHQAGVHKRCLERVRVKRAPRAKKKEIA